MPNAKQFKRGFNDVDVTDVVCDANSLDGSEIKNILQSLLSKMDSLNSAMSEVDKRLDVKIDKMESSLCAMINGVKDAMDAKFTSFVADTDLKLNNATESCYVKCVEMSNGLSLESSNRIDELRAAHDFRIDKLERLALANEIIISGVPVEHNDNPWGVVGDIIKATNCNIQQRDVAAVYRTKANNSNSSKNYSVPIVVKMYDVWAVRELFSCYFKKANLSLNDIGFKSNARIFINESLTKANRDIFRLAVEAKKANHIVKFHTRNGLVHVKRQVNSKPISMQHIGELRQILPPLFVRANNHETGRRPNAQGNHAVNKSTLQPATPSKNSAIVQPNASMDSNQSDTMDVTVVASSTNVSTS